MLVYFAYGSNMLRSRLEARTGRVELAGPARLSDYHHSFTKLGKDGTGKGNITRSPGDIVYGVLYRLRDDQIDRLSQFEPGYQRIAVPVQWGPTVDDLAGQPEQVTAHTFQAVRPVAPMRPASAYVSYYMRGMEEHGLPDSYRARVLSCIRTTG